MAQNPQYGQAMVPATDKSQFDNFVADNARFDKPSSSPASQAALRFNPASGNYE